MRAGAKLKASHFQNVPHTAKAWHAFQRKAPKEIVREHVVPRNVLVRIVRLTGTPEATKRVLKKYARIVLVHETECKRLDARSMPKDWDRKIDWGSPPRALPDLWGRYRAAKVVPRRWNRRPVF